MRSYLACLTVLGCLFLLVSPATADPLVTGDLALYFDFDEDWQATGVVPDKSNNNNTYDAKVEGRIYRAETAIRGDGAALFDSGGYYLPDVDPGTIDTTWFPDDYLQLGTLAPLAGPPDPEGWGRELTISMWVNARRYCDLSGGVNCDDMSLFGVRSNSRAWISHFQLQNDGRLRGQLRDDSGLDIAGPNVFLDGSEAGGPAWPEEEWFMYTMTYDSNATFEGEDGHWVQYFNGEKFNEGYAVPVAEPDGAGNAELGSWGMAFNIGRDMDEDRQFHGYLDEYYIFTRALTPEEVVTLYDVDPVLLGDLNGDGEVNGLDVDPFVDVLLNGPFHAAADMNEDGDVNGLDVDPFVVAVVGGGSQQIPEPSTLLLGLVALGVIGGWRKWGP